MQKCKLNKVTDNSHIKHLHMEAMILHVQFLIKAEGYAKK